MHVIVLGGGVIGTASAYYLAKQGAKVTVIERQADVAEETSFGNAGQVSPGYSTPWASPAIPPKAIKWLFEKHAPLKIRPDGTGFQVSWMLKMLANCNATAYEINKERMMRVAEYSRDCLKQLRADTSISYEHRTKGTLQLLRSQKQMDGIASDVKVLKELGVAHTVLDERGLSSIEPALANATGLVGGLHLPNDETGDCNLFTKALAQKAKELGVRFLFNHTIDSILHDGQKNHRHQSRSGHPHRRCLCIGTSKLLS